MSDRFALLPMDNQVSYEDDVLAARGLAPGSEVAVVQEGTTYVGVLEGAVQVRSVPAIARPIMLGAGMFAAVPAPAVIDPRHGRGLAVTIKRYTGMFALGGPIEGQGRLKYIDGCTDTGLIAPLKLGDPCLNCLYFPAHTTQTPHTHPSHRVGLIVDGRGWCLTEGKQIEMGPGAIFMIPTDVVHAFTTDYEAMRIIVVHPDSEVGPTDEVHQMLAATLIEARP